MGGDSMAYTRAAGGYAMPANKANIKGDAWVDVQGTVGRVTDKAILLTIPTPFGGNDVWIPRKVVRHGDQVKVGDTDIMVKEWFVKKEGIG